jgi:hypothetical protein
MEGERTQELLIVAHGWQLVNQARHEILVLADALDVGERAAGVGDGPEDGLLLGLVSWSLTDTPPVFPRQGTDRMQSDELTYSALRQIVDSLCGDNGGQGQGGNGSGLHLA